MNICGCNCVDSNIEFEIDLHSTRFNGAAATAWAFIIGLTTACITFAVGSARGGGAAFAI